MTETNPSGQLEALDLLAKWRVRRPDLALEVTRRIEEDQSWDGDGPHPGDDGMCAYVVTVTATRIAYGRACIGRDHLGGHWMEPHASLGNVAGYLPHMILAAVAECDNAVTAVLMG